MTDETPADEPQVPDSPAPAPELPELPELPEPTEPEPESEPEPEPEPTIMDRLVDGVLLELSLLRADATALQIARIAQRLDGAIGKVLAYLNRDSFETYERTFYGVWPDPSYPRTDMRAWADRIELPDTAVYVSHALTDGETEVYDVTIRLGLGLEGPETAAIRDFLIADVAEGLMGDVIFPTAPARVRSMSAGGHSLSFQGRAAGPDAAGGMANLSALTRFRRFAVGVSPTPHREPWPYSGPLP